MKQFLSWLLLTILLVGLMIPSIDTHAATNKTYYKTTLTSATGLNYTISVQSKNAKKKIATTTDINGRNTPGDVLYNGTFRLYKNNKATSFTFTDEYNKTAKTISKIATKKGTPSLLAVSSTFGTDKHRYKLYYVHKNKMKKVKGTYWSTLKPKYVSKNVFKVGFYDNQGSPAGYHVVHYKLNPATGAVKEVKQTYITSLKKW